MAISDFLPKTRRQAPAPQVEEAPVEVTEKRVDPDKLSNIIKSFRTDAMAVGNNSYSFSGFSKNRSSFEPSPYDFDRIISAIDTDSYAQQAFSKYRELIWKEGWDITGKNADAIAYLWKRINLFEVAMKRSFYDFLVDVADQLVKFGNVFIVKSRGDLAPFFPGKLYPPTGEKPIVGYYILPTEQVEIRRDNKNRPIEYRQVIGANGRAVFTSSSGDTDPVWPAKDVIHLVRNRKPGRIFGTPFVIPALDDIVSLRQIEEDALNLIHQELFPLYVYKIGTDLLPARPEDISAAEVQLSYLRTEGGLIAPHTHELEVLGSEGKALDTAQELAHFKERVAIGLGVFPHHLGMSSGAGNRSMTDRLDISLYDKVKEYQKYLSEQIRISVFNELLIEGGFDPYGMDSMQESLDRCMFDFKEIDKDTQIKVQTHTMGQYNADLISSEEARRSFGYDTNIEDHQTATDTKARIDNTYAVHLASVAKAAAAGTGPAKKATTPKKPANSRTPSKGNGNIIRPANQHGTRTSPNVRHSLTTDFMTELDTEWLDSVESLLDE